MCIRDSTYPDISISLVVTDAELDLSMREADVAVRMQRPTQSDLIQRRLMTVHTHIYASQSYLDRFGMPQTAEDLERHRLIAYREDSPLNVQPLNWILHAGHEDLENSKPRSPSLQVNNVYGMLKAAESGVGLASLPDYLANASGRLLQIMPNLAGPSFTAYFVYPEELRSSKRVAVFRDFLLQKVAQQAIW